MWSQSFSEGRGDRCHSVEHAIIDVLRPNPTGAQAALHSSGFFDEVLANLLAFEQRGLDGVFDTHHGALFSCLAVIKRGLRHPGSHDKVRACATALRFVLDHGGQLEQMSEIGQAMDAEAAKICAGVFGRDEGGSEFRFTAGQVDAMCVSVSVTSQFHVR